MLRARPRAARTSAASKGARQASALHHLLEAVPGLPVRRALHTSHVHSDNANLDVLPGPVRPWYNVRVRPARRRPAPC